MDAEIYRYSLRGGQVYGVHELPAGELSLLKLIMLTCDEHAVTVIASGIAKSYGC